MSAEQALMQLLAAARALATEEAERGGAVPSTVADLARAAKRFAPYWPDDDTRPTPTVLEVDRIGGENARVPNDDVCPVCGGPCPSEIANFAREHMYVRKGALS